MTKLITFISEAMFALVNYVVGWLQVALHQLTRLQVVINPCFS